MPYEARHSRAEQSKATASCRAPSSQISVAENPKVGRGISTTSSSRWQGLSQGAAHLSLAFSQPVQRYRRHLTLRSRLPASRVRIGACDIKLKRLYSVRLPAFAPQVRHTLPDQHAQAGVAPSDADGIITHAEALRWHPLNRRVSHGIIPSTLHLLIVLLIV